MHIQDASVIEGWKKAACCENSGPNCVEVAPHEGGVAMRNSTDPAGPALQFAPREWSTFLAGVKADHFDGILS